MNSCRYWSILSGSAKVPAARVSHGMATCGGDYLYVYGGYGSTSLGDLWGYSITENEWTDFTGLSSGSSPGTRVQFGFACATGRLWVHGGTFGEFGIRVPGLQIRDKGAGLTDQG